MLITIKLVGWLLARFPRPLISGIAYFLGHAAYVLLAKKRHIIMSNLYHAFPDRPIGELQEIGKASMRQLVETGLASLALPFASPDRLARMIRIPEASRKVVEEARANQRPILLLTPHLGCWELLPFLPALVEYTDKRMGLMYRPLKNKKLDAWTKKTRSRYGYDPFSRREGLREAMDTLREGGLLGILFDQHTANQGTLIYAMGRVASVTELPGLLAAKFKPQIITLYARRNAVWRYEAIHECHDFGDTSQSSLMGINQWLDDLLRSDDTICSSYLWAHRRWKGRRLLNLDNKRSYLQAYPEAPTRFALWIFLPDDSDNLRHALNALPDIQASRPDANITLLSCGSASRMEAPKLEHIEIHKNKAERADQIKRLQLRYPSAALMLSEDPQHDEIAKQLNCPERMGWVKDSNDRPLLSWKCLLPESGSSSYEEKLKHALDYFGVSTPDQTSTSKS